MNSSIWIDLPVPLVVARQLAVLTPADRRVFVTAPRGSHMREVQEKLFDKRRDGAVDPKRMHCTLVFLGKSSQYSAAAITELKKMFRWFFKGTTPIPASVTGVGRFSEIAPGTDLSVALIDSHVLTQIRTGLIASLANWDIDYTHGFIPHVSLLKQSSSETSYLDRIPRRDFEFTKVRLWVAGKPTVVSLVRR